MEEKVIAIRDDLKAEVLELAILIRHHEKILASVRGDLASLLRVAHGVNLNDPGTILDALGGVIVQRQPAAVEAAPAPSGEPVEASEPLGQE